MFRTLALSLIIALPLAAQAQPSVQDLSRCLADNTSGKDRKDLARWVFIAMASHPEIKKYASSEADAAAEESSRTTAGLFTRLLADNCSKQTQAAVKDGGTAAIQAAFQTLGQLAMQELMSDSNVKTRMGAFESYIDQNKLNQALTPK